MNFRPLCTAKVNPTMSGVTVERRDQVFTTRFSPDSIIARTFFIRWRSTKGPFLTERDTLFSSLLFPCRASWLFRLAPLEDELVGALVVAGLVALGGLAPGRLWMVALRAPLAAAVRMVDRIHGDAAHVRLAPEPAHASRLAVRHVLVLEVSHLPDRGPACEPHAPELRRRELQQRVVALLRHELDRGAGAASDLGATAGLQLDGMDRGPQRDVGQRQAVAGLDVGLRAGLDAVPDRQPDGCQDVRLRPVGIVEERDARRA